MIPILVKIKSSWMFKSNTVVDDKEKTNIGFEEKA